MLRWKDSSHYFGMALAALIISIPLVLFSMATFVQATQQTIQDPLKIAIETDRIATQGLATVKAGSEQRETAEVKETVDNKGYKQFGKEKLDKLAQKYNADPEYLYYIVQVEKTFNLNPCELLALIAQESGFKPQTHMDGGTLSYNTTQMKLATAKTAYMAITEYYKIDGIPFPTHELLRDDKYYAAFLAGGYLRYLHDVYNNDRYESYTAYNWGIGGRMTFYKNNGHFQSPYALKIASLAQSFGNYMGEEYNFT